MSKRNYLTPVEVAKILMVSTASVRLWASKGVLPAQTTAGGHRRFMMRDIEHFAETRGIVIETCLSGDLKLLVVDDDTQLAHYLSELLTDRPGIGGLEVAVDGFDAGQKVQSFQPDVILLDLMMPGMNGFEVCKRLKEEEATRGIRVVAMTGFCTQKNRERILAAGAEACLSKPLEKAALFEVLGIEP